MRTWHRMTKKEEAKLAEHWKTLEPRFTVSLTIPKYQGFRDVHMGLFRVDIPLEEMAALLGGLTSDPYVQDQAADTFTAAEVEQIKDFFAGWRERPSVTAEPAGAPRRNAAGHSTLPTGGLQQGHCFEALTGYSLPFKLHGYCDLRHHDRVPTKIGAGALAIRTAAATGADWCALCGRGGWGLEPSPLYLLDYADFVSIHGRTLADVSRWVCLDCGEAHDPGLVRLLKAACWQPPAKEDNCDLPF